MCIYILKSCNEKVTVFSIVARMKWKFYFLILYEKLEYYRKLTSEIGWQIKFTAKNGNLIPKKKVFYNIQVGGKDRTFHNINTVVVHPCVDCSCCVNQRIIMLKCPLFIGKNAEILSTCPDIAVCLPVSIFSFTFLRLKISAQVIRLGSIFPSQIVNKIILINEDDGFGFFCPITTSTSKFQSLCESNQVSRTVSPFYIE